MTTQEYVEALNRQFAGTSYRFSIDKPGAKYTRVVQESAGSRSAFCFIDGDGNIYKPASWKAPAKGIRSTLATVNIDDVDAYGRWLYR